ncbi:MAG: hypothetical protein HC887_04505 [Desulfobacteraceae bacterium]|nr:hypothetical protein [Desulfobacteraceae bacterium]
MFPISSADDPMNFTDALFTSTSATCVTGLAVRDTGSEMTLFGQFVILGLIQIGGLGIMTLSTIFLLIAGKRPSMTERILISDTFTYGGERSIREILQDIMMFTFSIEGIGAIILFFCFLPEMHWTKALYYSIFHSISAFCNAGFSLFSDSFVSFREDWVVNLTICFLIISGGIGFLVLSELKRYFPFDRKTWGRLSLHSKLVISSTIILLILSTLCILIIEWDNTLTSLSVPGRFLAAFFQAVNVRTAGFNTIAINQMANQTLFIMILMMLIGASPGSCGGGIKTTTVSTLAIVGMSRLLGYDRPQIFYRTIPFSSIWKAASVGMVSALVVVIGTLFLLTSELGEVSHLQTIGKFLELLFEAVSAFATVGLSTGITSEISELGEIILSMMMFAGRLGPMVLTIAVSRKQSLPYYYAEENIMIG